MRRRSAASARISPSSAFTSGRVWPFSWATPACASSTAARPALASRVAWPAMRSTLAAVCSSRRTSPATSALAPAAWRSVASTAGIWSAISRALRSTLSRVRRRARRLSASVMAATLPAARSTSARTAVSAVSKRVMREGWVGITGTVSGGRASRRGAPGEPPDNSTCTRPVRPCMRRVATVSVRTGAVSSRDSTTRTRPDPSGARPMSSTRPTVTPL